MVYHTSHDITRKESLKLAGRELVKGISSSLKCLKEVFVRPKRWQDCFSKRVYMSQKCPEIDWFAKNDWEDFDEKLSFNTEPYPLQVEKPADTEMEKDPRDAKSVYHKTYTTFTGCDAVCLFNGEAYGELQEYRVNVNGEFEGNIDLAVTRFTNDRIPPEDTLMVISYADEYGNAAYEIIHLNKLVQFKTSMSIDNTLSTTYMRFHGKQIQPRKELPYSVRCMSQEDFEAMVKRVREKCPHKEWIKFDEKLLNHLANRTYIWVLDTFFTPHE